MLNFWKRVFWISPAITLVVPSGQFVGPFFMAWAGLFFWAQAARYTPLNMPDLKLSWFLMLGGFFVLVLVGIGLAVWHSNHAGHYEMYVPFVLFPAIALLIRAGRWRAEPWLLSMALGAYLAFIYAVYQIFIQNIDRASGAAGNPITFGNTAIVLAAVALVSGVMFPFQGAKAKWKQAFVLFAGASGTGASLLSGSKGGWISLFIIGITVAYLSTQHWPAWRRHLSALAVVLSLLMAALLAPTHVVKDRVVSGLKGGWHWVHTGEVTEDSVSMRLEIWRLSAVVISEKPWFGHGSIGAHQRWEELSRQSGASPALASLYQANKKFVSSDNEFIGALKGGGVLGAIGLFAGYIGVWLAFWRWRKHSDAQIRTLASIGLLLVPVYLEFGLSVSVFGMNVFRSVFVMLAVCLLALLSVRLNVLKEVT
ncbi:MAG: O-antigen ligase family protein [Betaproteobacteria bacterium]|nr:O-antigen ligase family protein [Betaproteobacteria bacterium]